MKTEKVKVKFIIELVKDPNDNGYTSVLKQAPIISEGKTKEEAVVNMIAAIHDVAKYEGLSKLKISIPRDI